MRWTMWPAHLITFFMAAVMIACEEILVQSGGDIHFHLPGYEDCNVFSLLDPHLKPVVIIEGRDATNIIGQYEGRARIEPGDTGYTLTVSQATVWDSGDYKLAPSSRDMKQCMGISFQVVVQAGSTPAGETSGTWGGWSTCQKSCDTSSNQQRTRDCSLSSACSTSDASNETRTCDQAEHCPRWTEWGNWSDCSAKCGKGFRIRKRVCVNGMSALLKSTECQGAPTQSILCMTVCEVVGYWDPWSDWGNCTSECGGGTRNRTRRCVSDSRVTKTSCDGDGEQSEMCNDLPCATDPASSTMLTTGTGISNNTSNVTILVRDKTEPLNIAVVVIVSCIAGVVLIIVLVILLRRRCAENKTVNAIAETRTERGRRKPKSSTASTGDAQQPREQSAITTNVYSELSSSFCYPSGEFDSVFIDETPSAAKDVHVPKLENIAETAGDEHEELDGEADGDDEDIDDAGEFDSDNEDTTVNAVNENEVKEVPDIQEATENTDVLYVEPPQVYSSPNVNNFRLENPIFKFDIDSGSEAGSIYYEPPETPKSMSKKISTVSAISVKYASIGHKEREKEREHELEEEREQERERKESVYENIADVQRDTDDDDCEENDLSNTDTRNDVEEISNDELDIKDNISENNQDTSQPSDEAVRKELEAFYNEHIYVNYPERSVITKPEDTDSTYEEPKFND